MPFKGRLSCCLPLNGQYRAANNVATADTTKTLKRRNKQVRMEKEKNDRREMILNTFADIVALKGIDKTSLSMVAERADIPSSLIFYYFKNKQDLINQLWDYTLQTYRSCFFSGIKLDGDDAFMNLVQQAFLLPPYMNIHHHSLQHVFSCMQFYITIDKTIRKRYFGYTENNLKEYAAFFAYYSAKGVIHTEDMFRTARHFECVVSSANTIWAIYYKNSYDDWATSSMDGFCQAVGCSRELIQQLMQSYNAKRAFQIENYGY